MRNRIKPGEPLPPRPPVRGLRGRGGGRVAGQEWKGEEAVSPRPVIIGKHEHRGP